MNYDEGNVIEKRGLVFKDTYTPDPRGKHPAMLVLACDERAKNMYFLTLTSQTDKYFESPENKDRYFIIKKDDINMLKKSSLVNLQNIYKEPVSNEYPIAFIQPYEYTKIIRKFMEWQEKTNKQDEYYEEVKRLLEDGGTL